MFPIPLPWIIISAMVALFGTYRGGYHFGWEDRDQEMQIEIAKKNEAVHINLLDALIIELADKKCTPKSIAKLFED